MVLALLVFVAMFFQDLAASAKNNWLDPDNHHPWRAGCAEAVNDWGASLAIGLGGASVLRYGISMQTLEIEAALGLAAVLGTKLGDHVTQKKITRKANLPPS